MLLIINSIIISNICRIEYTIFVTCYHVLDYDFFNNYKELTFYHFIDEVEKKETIN